MIRSNQVTLFVYESFTNNTIYIVPSMRHARFMNSIPWELKEFQFPSQQDILYSAGDHELANMFHLKAL